MAAYCEKGHDLFIVMRKSDGYGSESVVKWCSKCGAIVIDQEYDGRCNAGGIMKMMFPLITVERNKNDN